MAWTDPKTWTAARLYASEMNTYVRDNQLALSTWQDYTPAWTTDVGGGSNPSLGNGTITGRYIQAGDLVHAHITLVIGSTSTAGTGRWQFSLPATAATEANYGPAPFIYKDVSAVTYYAGVVWVISDVVQIYMHHVSWNYMGASVAGYPVTIGDGDILSTNVTYEAA